MRNRELPFVLPVWEIRNCDSENYSLSSQIPDKLMKMEKESKSRFFGNRNRHSSKPADLLYRNLVDSPEFLFFNTVEKAWWKHSCNAISAFTFFSANNAEMHRQQRIRYLPMQSRLSNEQAMIATWTPSGCLSINLGLSSILFDLVHARRVRAKRLNKSRILQWTRQGNWGLHIYLRKTTFKKPLLVRKKVLKTLRLHYDLVLTHFTTKTLVSEYQQ